jgi:hypothetical protein
MVPLYSLFVYIIWGTLIPIWMMGNRLDYGIQDILFMEDVLLWPTGNYFINSTFMMDGTFFGFLI